MTMRPALWLLLASPLLSQVSVICSPVPQSVAARLLNKRVASQVSIWTVSLQNDSPDAVVVSESAVLHRIPQLSPIDHLAMTILIAEAAQNSKWAKAGRIAIDMSTLAAFIGAGRTSGNTLRWGSTAMYGIAAANALAPYIVQRFKGQERPVQQNFETLAWVSAVSLQPGDSAVERVFTARWDKATPVSFVIETGKARTAREIR